MTLTSEFPNLDAAMWAPSKSPTDARTPIPTATVTDEDERIDLVIQTCLRVQFLALRQCSEAQMTTVMQEALIALGFTPRGRGVGREFIDLRQACAHLSDDLDRWFQNGLSDEALGRARLAAAAQCFTQAHALIGTDQRDGLEDAVAEAMDYAASLPKRILLK